MLAYFAAMTPLDPTDLLDLYWAGRATLVSRHPDDPVYDQVFRRYFLGEDAPAATVLTLDPESVAEAEERWSCPAPSRVPSRTRKNRSGRSSAGWRPARRRTTGSIRSGRCGRPGTPSYAGPRGRLEARLASGPTCPGSRAWRSASGTGPRRRPATGRAAGLFGDGELRLHGATPNRPAAASHTSRSHFAGDIMFLTFPNVRYRTLSTSERRCHALAFAGYALARSPNLQLLLFGPSEGDLGREFAAR